MSQLSLENQPSFAETALATSGESVSSPNTLRKILLFGQQVSFVLEQVPQYWVAFWQAYQRPLMSLVWAVVAIVTVKILIAVLVAINSFPFLGSLLQVIGLGYTLWFAWHNLLSFAKRQALLAKLDELLSYIWGDS